ncbi:MAG: hypothetical protein ABGX16_24940 [Pirellulales bacterium]
MAQPTAAQPAALLGAPPRLSVVVPPLDSKEHRSTPGDIPLQLPIADTPFFEHVRRELTQQEQAVIAKLSAKKVFAGLPQATTLPISIGGTQWVGALHGLYSKQPVDTQFKQHPTYGIDGPPSNIISGMVVDSRQRLWVATAAGLSFREPSGNWHILRGRDGLPAEHLTSVAIDSQNRLWLGSDLGLIQYRPYADGRQWYFRAGRRYLPDNRVTAIHISDDDRSVFVNTQQGWSCIEDVERTLASKAAYLEARYQQRHRRLGMPSPATYPAAGNTEQWVHEPQASDGLWTSYHIAAMCYAYTLTGEDRYRDAAKEGMEALYTLQNITGIHGLVARSMATVDEPAAAKLKKQTNWLPTDDGKFIWRDDVSSDQITGHYFAFHLYYQHIARHDPKEKARLIKQIRQVTDYILDHNYQIIDWDGKKTLWGWWNPKLLNEEPGNFLESGIYSLMMLSFLKTTHTITGDEKYLEHYLKLIEKHSYLSNLLLQKKVFPDELNHSDDQLSALVFYSYMQLEHDPFIRDAIHRSLRRHARIERDERNSLFAFVYAVSDPEDADILGGVQTLREMPQDRRNWHTDNTIRADVVSHPQAIHSGQQILLEVLPADERNFERWNADPYQGISPGNGLSEGAGVHWLLPYWLGRYHGLIGGPMK